MDAHMETVSCGSCGAVTQAAARFCSACGGVVAASVGAAAGLATDPPPAGLPPPLPGTYAPPVPHPHPYGYGAPNHNGLAIASMVLGILWIYWIGSILALVLGYVALGQIKRSDGTQGGRGTAIAGVVLGWVGLAFLVLFLTLAIAAASQGTSGRQLF